MFLFSGAHVRGMPVEVAVVVNVELSQRQERRDGLIEAHPAGVREVYTWLYARSTQRWLACLQVSPSALLHLDGRLSLWRQLVVAAC